MPSHQLSLTLIPHKVAESIVDQRASDGYINATAMCKAAGKQFNEYTSRTSTKEFLDELSPETGIPVSGLIQVLKGGTPELQGSWVHPQVAIHLAQWVSAKFAVQVSKWVFDWISGKGQPAKLPFHLERHMINAHKVPNGYFSVLQEMTMRLVAPMEAQGYRLPEKLMPDISHGRMLCKFLRERHGIDTDSLFKYVHTFPDGHLGEFLKLLAEDWFPNQAAAYFKKRDPVALIALDKILLIAHTAQPAAPQPRRIAFRKSAISAPATSIRSPFKTRPSA